MGCPGNHLPGEDSPTCEVERSWLPWTCVLQSKKNVLVEREIAKNGTSLLSLQKFVDLVHCKNLDEHAEAGVSHVYPLWLGTYSSHFSTMNG